MKNLFILSVPRSGSTWFAKRLAQINNSNLIMEPFRRFFNTDKGNRISCHRAYKENDFDDPDFWSKLSGFEKNRFFLFVDWANRQNGLVIKDVVGLFQIPFLMRAYWENIFRCYFLKVMLYFKIKAKKPPPLI